MSRAESAAHYALVVLAREAVRVGIARENLAAIAKARVSDYDNYVIFVQPVENFYVVVGCDTSLDGAPHYFAIIDNINGTFVVFVDQRFRRNNQSVNMLFVFDGEMTKHAWREVPVSIADQRSRPERTVAGVNCRADTRNCRGESFVRHRSDFDPGNVACSKLGQF